MSECVGPFEQLAKLRPSRVVWLGVSTREGCTESLFLSLFVCVWTAISQNADLQDDFMIRTGPCRRCNTLTYHTSVFALNAHGAQRVLDGTAPTGRETLLFMIFTNLILYSNGAAGFGCIGGQC